MLEEEEGRWMRDCVAWYLLTYNSRIIDLMYKILIIINFLPLVMIHRFLFLREHGTWESSVRVARLHPPSGDASTPCNTNENTHASVSWSDKASVCVRCCRRIVAALAFQLHFILILNALSHPTFSPQLYPSSSVLRLDPLVIEVVFQLDKYKMGV